MGAFTELTAVGITELVALTGAELRLRVRAAELSRTLLLGIVEVEPSVEKAMEWPAVEAFPVMAFLSSSTLEDSPPVFPSSGWRKFFLC